ncbi:lysozyme-family localization factor SpmX [Caulobacter sp. RHG1]|uniref:lysozyme-family localization factor SpmX n=1 Tax=Caulobacter sp. (strain RHG1) TaxID=2545762 RepID=UPI001554BD83|nr:lysozyme-family localization factor SpmX [Caulobacter sp. RHG1]NQE63060.1 Lysozyme family protein [Caulobacter sp. RHG1]
MKPRHQVTRASVDLIKRFEGYRQKAAKLPDGRWTVGYGHTLTAREGASVSEKDAEALLLYDLISVAHSVNENTYAPLNQNQFDALVCFAFNIGLDNFLRSGVLRRINEGSLLQAACAMEMWRKADFEGERIVIDALVRRRAAEKTLFLTPANGEWVPAPSPVLRPKVDYDASCAIPKQTPIAVNARTEGDRVVTEREEGLPLNIVVPEEDGPTATEQSAAAVSARLEAILADAPPIVTTTKPAPVQDDLVLPEPPPPAQPAVTEPAPVLFQDEPTTTPVVETATPLEFTPFRLTPQPVEEVEKPTPVESFAPAAPVAEPSLFTAPAAGPSVFNLGGFSTSDEAVSLNPMDVPLVEAEQPRFGNTSLLISLGILGLALFGGGVLWILTVAAGSDTGVKMFGYGASMIGAICFVVSAYLLLRRLAGPDADGEE